MDVANGPRQDVDDLDTFDTFERIIAHEIMHVARVGYKPGNPTSKQKCDLFREAQTTNIIPVEDEPDALRRGDTKQIKIYGEKPCRQYAKKEFPSVNFKVITNGELLSNH
jgi:hypothetical protein